MKKKFESTMAEKFNYSKPSLFIEAFVDDCILISKYMTFPELRKKHQMNQLARVSPTRKGSLSPRKTRSTTDGSTSVTN